MLASCWLLCCAGTAGEAAWDVRSTIKSGKGEASAAMLTALTNGGKALKEIGGGNAHSATTAVVAGANGRKLTLRVGEIPAVADFLSLVERLPTNASSSGVQAKEANDNALEHLRLILSPQARFFHDLNSSLAATSQPAIMILLNCPQYHLFQASTLALLHISRFTT